MSDDYQDYQDVINPDPVSWADRLLPNKPLLVQDAFDQKEYDTYTSVDLPGSFNSNSIVITRGFNYSKLPGSPFMNIEWMKKTPLHSIIRTLSVNGKTEIYILYLMKKNNIFKCEDEIASIYKEFEQNKTLFDKLKNVFILTDATEKNTASKNYYEGGFTTDLFKLKRMFPSFNVSSNKYDYVCTPPQNKYYIESFEYEKASFGEGGKQVYEIGKVNLPDMLLFDGDGIMDILIRIQSMSKQNSMIKETWKRSIEVILREYKRSFKDQEKDLLSNLLMYEELLKKLFLTNGEYAKYTDKDGNIVQVNSRLTEFVKGKLHSSIKEYFRDFLSRPENKDLRDALKKTQKDIGGKTFYFPNLYRFTTTFYDKIKDTVMKKYENTEFNTSLYFDDVGYLLSVVITEMIQGKTETKEVKLNKTITSKMKAIAPKIKIFVKKGMSTEELQKVIHVILECDDFSEIPIPIDMIDAVLSELGSEKFGMGDLDVPTFKTVVGVMYHYSLYCYQTCETLLKDKMKQNPTEQEQDIKAHLDKINTMLQTLPNISSDLFTAQGVQGCIAEAFLEFTVMYADLLDINAFIRGSKDVGDVSIINDSVYQFCGAQKNVAVPTPVSWITADYLKSFYERNDIHINRETCAQLYTMLLQFMNSYESNRSNIPFLNKFIRQFTNRKNVLPAPTDTPVVKIKPVYDMKMLLLEQNSLRQSHDKPYKAITQKEIISEEMGNIITLLSQNPGPRATFVLVNRMNALESYIQDEKPRAFKITHDEKEHIEAIKTVLTPDELKILPEEKRRLLYELHCKRNMYAFNERQINSIHIELLTILKARTLAFVHNKKTKTGTTPYSVITPDVIDTLLQSMGRYDITHLLLFYSILNRCAESCTPGMIFDIHPELMLLNKEQDVFVRDLIDHLKWLEKVHIFRENHLFLQIFQVLLKDDGQQCKTDTNVTSPVPVECVPRYHIVEDIDTYDPSTNMEWITNKFKQRNKDMTELIKNYKTNIIRDWIQFLPTQPKNMRWVCNKMLQEYETFMNPKNIFSNIQEALSKTRKLIADINSIIIIIDGQFLAFMNELRQNLIRKFYVLTYQEAIDAIDIANVEFLLSYYTYGSMYKPVTDEHGNVQSDYVLTDFLFVHRYEHDVEKIKDMKERLTHKTEVVTVMKPIVAAIERNKNVYIPTQLIKAYNFVVERLSEL